MNSFEQILLPEWNVIQFVMELLEIYNGSSPKLSNIPMYRMIELQDSLQASNDRVWLKAIASNACMSQNLQQICSDISHIILTVCDDQPDFLVTKLLNQRAKIQTLQNIVAEAAVSNCSKL